MGSYATEQPLPPRARPDLAWTDTVKFEQQVTPQEFKHTVPGERVELIQTVFCRLITSAAPGNRLPRLAVADASGNFLYIIPQGATQGPGLVVLYTWSVQLASIVPTTVIYAAAPLPSYPLLPGYSIDLALANPDVGDVINLAVMGSYLIPTGPGRGSAELEPAAVAPPVLV